MNKKGFVWLFFLVIAIVPAMAFAATEFRTGDELIVREGETINQNLYAAGGTVVIEGSVRGDILVGGGNVLISGSTTKDVLVAGGNLTISGETGDDLRAAGGSITVSGSVKGDVVVAGGNVHLTSQAKVDGDVTVFGGRVRVDGSVKGEMNAAGGDIELNGPVVGDVVIYAGNGVVLGSQALIQGNFTYSAPKEVMRVDGAQVKGKIIYQQSNFTAAYEEPSRSVIAGLFGTWWLFKLLVLLVTVFLITYLWRRRVTQMVSFTTSHFGKAVLIGFVFLAVIPVVIILSFITFVGVLVGAILGFLYVLWILFAAVGGNIVVAALLSKYFDKSAGVTLSWKYVFAGVLLLQLVSIIPIFGWIISFVMFCAALGSIAHFWYEHVWVTR